MVSCVAGAGCRWVPAEITGLRWGKARDEGMGVSGWDGRCLDCSEDQVGLASHGACQQPRMILSGPCRVGEAESHLQDKGIQNSLRTSGLLHGSLTNHHHNSSSGSGPPSLARHSRFW